MYLLAFKDLKEKPMPSKRYAVFISTVVALLLSVSAAACGTGSGGPGLQDGDTQVDVPPGEDGIPPPDVGDPDTAPDTVTDTTPPRASRSGRAPAYNRPWPPRRPRAIVP